MMPNKVFVDLMMLDESGNPDQGADIHSNYVRCHPDLEEKVIDGMKKFGVTNIEVSRNLEDFVMEVLIVDIETTDIKPEDGCIVEVGIVALNLKGGNVRVILNDVCKEPSWSIEHTMHPKGWIFRNSDLTPEEVSAAKPSEIVFEEVQVILDSFPLGATAFNKNFDFNYLRSRGITIPKELPCPMALSTPLCKIPSQYPKFHGKYKWPSVEEAWAHFFPKIDYVELHRGADDAIHEALIVNALYQLGEFKV